MSIQFNSSAANPLLSERFRAAMDVSSDAMFLIHPASMAFLDVNNTACRLLGYAREELLSMAPMMLTGHPREYHQQLYDELIAGNHPAAATPVTLHSKSGTPLTLEMHYLAELSEAGWMIVAVARDTSEVQRARMMMAQANVDLARLSVELQMAREEERSSLANRLHGDLGQLLAALRINLSLLQQRFPEINDCAQALAGMDKLVASSIASLRSISAELRPKGVVEGELQQGLIALQEQAAERFSLNSQLQADAADLLLDESRSTMVYRLVQELLTDVLPQADARNVEIEFKQQADALQLSVRSDGTRAALADAHDPCYRLASLCERVRLMQGTIGVASEGAATRIVILLPNE